MKTLLRTRRLGTWGSGLLLAGLMLTARQGHAQVDTYSFAPSSGTFTPLPSTATSESSIEGDDQISGTIPLGFNFTFDGTVYTSCKVSSNGWLTFNTSSTYSNLTNELATGAASERPLVAPFWDDLNGTNGTASYLTTGASPNRTFTFEWKNWIRYGNSTGPSFSMQVQLVEGTNVVRFVYTQLAGAPITGAAASIGLSGVGSGPGTFLSLSDSSPTATVSAVTETDNIGSLPATGQVYSFTPPAPSPCATPRLLTGTTTTTTAALSWQATTGATYTVLYGPAGFDPNQISSPTNTYTTATNVPTPPYNITGLAPGTTYQFYVTANCGGTNGNSTRSNAGSFTTQIVNDEPCGAAILTINNTCTPLSTTSFGATPTTGVSAGSCAAGFPTTTPADVWYKFTTAATGPTSTQVRISVTGTAANTVRAYSGASCTGTLTFLNCAASGDNTTPAPDLDLTGLTPSTTYYVRVGAYDSFQPTLGSFTICAVPVPNCPPPIGLAVGTITNTTAVLNWTLASSTGNTFTVIYGPVGFTPPSGTGSTSITGITGQTTTVTGLQANTNYEFYVQQVCGGFNGSSILAGPISFATPLTAPANNEPCGAIGLGAGVLTSTNVGATTSSQPGISTPACSPASLPKDVWFSFVASSTTATFAFTGTAAGMVRVYSSPSCSAGPFALVSCVSSGSNSTAITAPVNVAGLTVGTRYYMAVSGYGSSDPSGTFTIAPSAGVLAARAQTDTDALLVYPNPSSTGQLTLKLSGLSGAGQATLLNALGQVVLTKNLTAAAEQTLSTRNLATGLYTLRVEAGSQVLTRKVVLE
ncbi:fibronectin type III domain-containing protein [Hymenobacter negativus]|uniref:Fibronectin type III domain-containing protein n=1 Tax=Hymenobacter negativus TaxID=2795026 RepID=A0ABS3QNQ5_9BACT|nr:fibronectin type III domain-containing protein [Hymenobacter negativus]MBO2012916.1 fibronectin type III domain-containing protein [Hymenobacter negativus]